MILTPLAPLAAPQQGHIPIGAIPVRDETRGRIVAYILPQDNEPLAAYRMAQAITASIPIIYAVKHLDRVTDHSAEDVSTFSTWRQIRQILKVVEGKP